MGLIIRGSAEDLKTPETFKPDPDCEVCKHSEIYKEKNDLECIFGMLEDVRKNNGDLASADDSMCDYHKKKAQGLKIFSTKDELFELDAAKNKKIFSGVPDAKPISARDYNKKVEIDNGEIEM